MKNWRIDAAATGAVIRNLIKQRGYQVSDISGFMNFQEPRAVYKWMNGTALPSLENFVRLSRLLDVKLDDMIQVREYEDGRHIE